MIGVLVISHEPLGTSLIHCTRHIFGHMLPQLAALDVIPDEDTAEAIAAAQALCTRINDGSGVLVLTDVMGATPSRIAAALAIPHRIVVVAGVNLPLLVKALTHRRGAELEALVDQLLPAAREAIVTMLPGMFEPITATDTAKVEKVRKEPPSGAAEDKSS
ncbi:MAG: PTS sugar transporter subunit IIA [Burkholderiaceae bacterium]